MSPANRPILVAVVEQGDVRRAVGDRVHGLEDERIVLTEIENGVVLIERVFFSKLLIHSDHAGIRVDGAFGAGNEIVSHKTTGDAILPLVQVRLRIQGKNLCRRGINASRVECRILDALGGREARTRELRK